MSEARTSAGAATRIALVMLGMSALLNMYSTQPILGEVARWAGVGVETAAWTVSATTAGVALVAPWAGMLSDAWGRRRVILSAVLAMALLGLPGLVVNSFWLLLAMRFAQGMCCPFIFAVVVAYLGEEYAARQAARLNALYIAGTALGGFAGRMVAALVSDCTGQWRLSFLANTVVLLVTWVVAWFFLPPERRFVPRRRGGNNAVTGLSPGGFLSRWRLLCTILVGATLLFQQTASFTFASLRLGEPPFSLSTSAIGMVFLVFLLPMATTPLSGRMMQRWGELRVFVLFQLVGAVGIAVTLIPALPAMLCGRRCPAWASLPGRRRVPRWRDGCCRGPGRRRWGGISPAITWAAPSARWPRGAGTRRRAGARWWRSSWRRSRRGRRWEGSPGRGGAGPALPRQSRVSTGRAGA